MKRGDQVQVKDAASVDSEYRGRTGTVIADTAPGQLVDVEFDDEAVTHSFNAIDLESL
jgi:hypothetical protein